FIWISKCAIAFDGCKRVFRGSVLLLTLWSVVSSLCVYPHSLSYFNEFVGGPCNGHLHLLESNVAWGQDLIFLRRWIDQHPEAKPLRLASFGRVDPRILGI